MANPAEPEKREAPKAELAEPAKVRRNAIAIGKQAIFCGLYGLAFLLLERFTTNTQQNSAPSVWYPPAALTFALLLGGGARYIPLAVFAMVFSEWFSFNSPIFSFYSLGGGVIAASIYSWLARYVRNRTRDKTSANSVENIQNYIVATMAGSVLVAILGAAFLCMDHQQQWAHFPSFVFSWWVGDAVALLCVCPFLVAFVLPPFERWLGGDAQKILPLGQGPSQPWTVANTVQLAVQLSCMSAVLLIIYLSRFSHNFDLLYLCFLPVVWVALTHGLRGTILATLALNIGLMTIFPAAMDNTDVIIRVHILQLCVAIAGLFLGASITGRETVERELVQRTAYFQKLITNNPIATLVRDGQGRVEMSNLAFERLFQYTEGEMQGQAVESFIVPAGLAEEGATIVERLLAGEAIHTTTRRQRKDGTLLDVEVHGIPLIVKDKLLGILTLYEDLTERKKLEGQLLLAGKLQAVGRLAGGIAHDFNNVVGVIQGYAEYLLERLPAESVLRESAQEILHASHRTSAMTRQLLAFSRKQVLQLKVVNLNTIIQDFEKMLGRLIPTDIEQMFVPGQNLLSMKVDAGQMEQVIMNLVVNARDAMPGGGTLTISTQNIKVGEEKSGAAKPGDYIVLTVSDTGIGMSPETKALIFDPFFTTKEKDKGTGMGLATVYGIVNQCEGFIEVDSAPGKGSTFRVYFPSVDAKRDAAEAPEVGNMAKGSETILLVEDDKAFRKMTLSLLQDAGYQVLEAGNGAEAVALAQDYQGRIHLLLTDVIMPKMRGPQAAKYLTLLRPDIKVLFMSGYTDGEFDKAEFRGEETAFIQKPFSRAALTNKIREVVESQRTLTNV